MGLLHLVKRIIMWGLILVLAIPIVIMLLLQILFPKEMQLIWTGQAGKAVAQGSATIARMIAAPIDAIIVRVIPAGLSAGGMTVGVIIGAAFQGVMIGFMGIWVLLKTGSIDELVKMGQELMKGNQIIATMYIMLRVFPPFILLALLGVICIDIVKFKFLDIPGDIGKVIGMVVSVPFDIANVWRKKK